LTRICRNAGSKYGKYEKSLTDRLALLSFADISILMESVLKAAWVLCIQAAFLVLKNHLY